MNYHTFRVDVREPVNFFGEKPKSKYFSFEDQDIKRDIM